MTPLAGEDEPASQAQAAAAWPLSMKRLPSRTKQLALACPLRTAVPPLGCDACLGGERGEEGQGVLGEGEERGLEGAMSRLLAGVEEERRWGEGDDASKEGEEVGEIGWRAWLLGISGGRDRWRKERSAGKGKLVRSRERMAMG